MANQVELKYPGYSKLVPDHTKYQISYTNIKYQISNLFQYKVSISDIDIQYHFQMNGNLSWMATQVEVKYPGYSKLVPDHWVRYPQVQYQHQLSNMIIKYHLRY